jgi:hypothetical protein
MHDIYRDETLDCARRAYEEAQRVRTKTAALYQQTVEIDAYVRQIMSETGGIIQQSYQQIMLAKATLESCWKDPFAQK